MEDRKCDFYDKDQFDMKRIEEVALFVTSKLTLNETLKMMRELVYDQVAYYDKDTCARLYNEELGYTKIMQENASFFQQMIRTYSDLFGQVIVDKREHNEDYLKNYRQAGPYIKRIKELEKRLAEYE